MTSDSITAGDLTTEHYGLLVRYEVAPSDGPMPGPTHREVVCDELRRWVHNGKRRVEITDFTPDGPFIGRARHLDADTPVTVLRRIRKARRRPWGKGALKPGETWATAVGAETLQETS